MFATSRCRPRSCRPVPRAPVIQRKAADGADTLWRELATTIRGPQRDAAAERDALVPDADYLRPLEGQGRPLPGTARAAFEPAFGYDFDDVRVHTDGFAAASARAFGARAYAYGRHVVFGAGEFDTASPRGQQLIAHELTHVVQQSGAAAPAVQRQLGPFDLQPDVCVTAPVVGEVCGSGAAKVCSQMRLPGCDAVCKVFPCTKPKQETKCPPGWQATGASGFEGQCCKGTIANAKDCCPPERIALSDFRCCGPDEFVQNGRCTKSSDLPPLPMPFCLPGQRTVLGECCTPPEVPLGLRCGVPPPQPTPPQPTPPAPRPVPVLPPIFFKLDRPFPGEGGTALPRAATTEGKDNFDALVAAMKADPALKVQLVGRASPEGSVDYNRALGTRRARIVAAALKDAGIAGSRIADPPDASVGGGCTPVDAGVATCGKAGASGERDRQVEVRAFGP